MMRIICQHVPTKYRNRIFRLFFYSDLVAVRFVLGLAELIWAFTLLWPGATFGRPTYHIMSLFFSEEIWGLIFLITGFTQWTLILREEFHTRTAIVFSAWNASLWILVCASMYFSVYPPPAAISGEAALSVAALFVYLRSGYIITSRRKTDAT